MKQKKTKNTKAGNVQVDDNGLKRIYVRICWTEEHESVIMKVRQENVNYRSNKGNGE